MDFETLSYARDGHVATLTLDRQQALNAITPQMLRELEAAIGAAAGDAEVRVVVVTGAGRAFSAGVDLKALGGAELSGGSVGELLDAPARRVIALLGSIDQPTIARVNGYCFTGALELALGCDLMVVAEEARLGDTHAKWGLRPTWGMSARLPAMVGVVRARELSMTARSLDGREAHAIGLAVRCAPLAELDAAVGALCDELLANSPGSIAAYKALYRDPALEQALEREASARFHIPDTAERLGGFRK